MMMDLMNPFNNKKKKKSESSLYRVPDDFMEAVDMKKMVTGDKTRADFLRNLAKEIKPTEKELRRKGLFKDE